MQYLELETRISKPQRSDSKIFEFTKLKGNINQETLDGHGILMEKRLIGIMIEYLILLPKAINILLQIVQGII